MQDWTEERDTRNDKEVSPWENTQCVVCDNRADGEGLVQPQVSAETSEIAKNSEWMDVVCLSWTDLVTQSVLHDHVVVEVFRCHVDFTADDAWLDSHVHPLVPTVCCRWFLQRVFSAHIKCIFMSSSSRVLVNEEAAMSCLALGGMWCSSTSESFGSLCWSSGRQTKMDNIDPSRLWSSSDCFWIVYECHDKGS